MERKVNFVYPNDLSKNIGVYPPLGIGYLAAYLSNKGYQTRVFDLTFCKDWLSQLSQEPQIYAITSTSTLSSTAFRACLDIKRINKHNVVIMGGPHPTVLPEDTCKNPHVDFVVVGEGELTLFELCEAIIDSRSLAKVKGICFKAGSKVKKTAPRPPIENIDLLPFPRQDLFPLEIYFALRNIRELSIISSRGCYGDCTYCQPCLRAIFGKKLRFRSAKNVVAEIKQLKEKHNPDIIVFSDDTFGIGNHADMICEEIIRQKIDIIWRCQARVNISEKTLRLMKLAGCIAIAFGVETGDETILKNIRKYTKLDDVRKAFNACKRIGILAHAYLMVGNVGETKSSVLNTCMLLREIKPFSIEVHLTTPLPGTYLFDEAREKGWLKGKPDWSTLSYTEDTTLTLDLPTMSHEELLRSRHYIKECFGKIGYSNKLVYLVNYLADPASILRVIRFAIRKPKILITATSLMFKTVSSGVGVAFTNPSRLKELSVAAKKD
ncbi:MAG: radical SAM protein [Candidatus Woesearchaeota archaeon]